MVAKVVPDADPNNPKEASHFFQAGNIFPVPERRGEMAHPIAER
jgi:hypothetical protein